MGVVRGAALAAGALAALVMPASAGAILVERQGVFAAAAVDQAGTAHVAYHAVGPTLRYCRVGAGSRVCGARRTLAGDQFAQARPAVFIGPAGEVVVLDAQLVQGAGPAFLRWLAWVSRDGGDTFSGPMTPPAAQGAVELTTQALILNDRLLDLTTREEPNGGTFARSTRVGSDPSGLGARLFNGPRPNRSPTGKGPGPSFEAAIGVFGSRPVVVVSDDGRMSFAAHTGTGDVNDSATWSAPQSVVGLIDPTQLAASQGQLFLGSFEGAGAFRVRRFDGSSFDAGTTVVPSSSRVSIAGPTLATGADGRLAAAWGYGDVIRLRNSSDGVSWSPALNVACAAGSPEDVALSSSGRGVVVLRDVNALRLVPIARRHGSCPGNPPSLRRGGTTVSLLSREQCFTSGARVRLEVLTRGQRRGRPRVVRTAFRIGSGRRVTVTRSPQRASLRFPAAAPDSLVATSAVVTLSGLRRPLVLRDRLRSC